MSVKNYDENMFQTLSVELPSIVLPLLAFGCGTEVLKKRKVVLVGGGNNI